MQSNGEGFGATPSISTASLDSLDYSLADCSTHERNFLSNILDNDVVNVVNLAIHAILGRDEYYNDKFREHFLSLYSEHRFAVKNSFYDVLYQAFNVQTRIFKIQCRGETTQCPDGAYAVTDFLKKGIILVNLFS